MRRDLVVTEQTLGGGTLVQAVRERCCASPPSAGFSSRRPSRPISPSGPRPSVGNGRGSARHGNHRLRLPQRLRKVAGPAEAGHRPAAPGQGCHPHRGERASEMRRQRSTGDAHNAEPMTEAMFRDHPERQRSPNRPPTLGAAPAAAPDAGGDGSDGGDGVPVRRLSGRRRSDSGRVRPDVSTAVPLQSGRELDERPERAAVLPG